MEFGIAVSLGGGVTLVVEVALGEVALGDGATDVVSARVTVVDSPTVSAGDDRAVHRTQANASRAKARSMAVIQ